MVRGKWGLKNKEKTEVEYTKVLPTFKTNLRLLMECKKEKNLID